MAIASPLVLADTLLANKNFVTISTDSTGSVRIDDSTTLNLPRYLSIRHSAQKSKTGDITDRHLVQFAVTKADVAGKQATATLNLTIAVPRNGIVARADINDLVTFVKNMIVQSTILDSLLRNER